MEYQGMRRSKTDFFDRQQLISMIISNNDPPILLLILREIRTIDEISIIIIILVSSQLYFHTNIFILFISMLLVCILFRLVQFILDFDLRIPITHLCYFIETFIIQIFKHLLPQIIFHVHEINYIFNPFLLELINMLLLYEWQLFKLAIIIPHRLYDHLTDLHRYYCLFKYPNTTDYIDHRMQVRNHILQQDSQIILQIIIQS